VVLSFRCTDVPWLPSSCASYQSDLRLVCLTGGMSLHLMHKGVERSLLPESDGISLALFASAHCLCLFSVSLSVRSCRHSALSGSTRLPSVGLYSLPSLCCGRALWPQRANVWTALPLPGCRRNPQCPSLLQALAVQDSGLFIPAALNQAAAS
jgi:hypothetical protein